MDPDETLRQIRLLIKQMRVDESPEIRKQHADDLAELIEALDEWLSKGGFSPAAWAVPDDLRSWFRLREENLRFRRDISTLLPSIYVDRFQHRWDKAGPASQAHDDLLDLMGEKPWSDD